MRPFLTAELYHSWISPQWPAVKYRTPALTFDKHRFKELTSRVQTGKHGKALLFRTSTGVGILVQVYGTGAWASRPFETRFGLQCILLSTKSEFRPCRRPQEEDYQCTSRKFWKAGSFWQ